VGTENLEKAEMNGQKNWMDVIRQDLKKHGRKPGKKPKTWRQTEQNGGVNVWTNASIRT